MRPRSDAWLAATVARLDVLAHQPWEELGDLVATYGVCMHVHPAGDPPRWLFEDGTDREIADRLCAKCTVKDECLELELRLYGDQTVGVWGALPENDRRVIHRFRENRRSADRTEDQ